MDNLKERLEMAILEFALAFVIIWVLGILIGSDLLKAMSFILAPTLALALFLDDEN